jgi:hypothetical protein
MARGPKSKNRRRRIPRESVDDLFIIGFDAEWQNEGSQNRLLSFQWSVHYRGQECTGIAFYANGERPRLSELVQQILTEAKSKDLFSHFPKQVFLVSHFTLAELSILKDFDLLKSRFDTIRGSFTSLMEPLPVKITDGNRNQRWIELHLRDSLHLTPQGARLEVLGQIHGIPKVELPPGAIQNMAKLLETDRALFAEYAITDARIAAFHARKMAKLNRELTGRAVVPISLGGLAVAFALECWKKQSIDPLEVLGKVEVKEEEFDPRIGRIRKKKKTVLMATLHEYEALAVEAYHGGRNEAFLFGPTPVDDWLDVDLKGAYATSLASVGMPQWLELRHSVNLEDFHAGVLGAARIHFKFPATVRFPTLPVRLPNNLIFPLEGETYATSPEIEAARALGASIEILSGFVIPMNPAVRPFENVIADCTRRRNESKKKDDDLGNRLYKEIANSLYGKVAQGLRRKRVFDSRSGDRKELPPSKVTQAFIAGYVTGLIRAALGELINSVAEDREIISVTTDGFITNESLETLESKTNGPSCTVLRDARKRLLGESSILEVKHTVRQVLCFRTRGQATMVLGVEGTSPLLAKAGIKPPPEIVGKDSQNGWMVRQFIERSAETTIDYKSLATLRQIYETNGDLVAVGHRRKLGMEFDFKRKPSIRMMGKLPDGQSHLTFLTTPFATEKEYRFYRESWQNFARSGRSLKTEEDLRDFEEFLAGEQLRERGIKRSSEGLAKVAMRQFLRRLVRGTCGLASGLESNSYEKLADRLSVSGVEVTVSDLKNAGRPRVKMESHSIPPTPEVMRLVSFLRGKFPDWDAQELLSGDAPEPTLESGSLPDENSPFRTANDSSEQKPTKSKAVS